MSGARRPTWTSSLGRCLAGRLCGRQIDRFSRLENSMYEEHNTTMIRTRTRPGQVAPLGQIVPALFLRFIHKPFLHPPFPPFSFFPHFPKASIAPLLVVEGAGPMTAPPLPDRITSSPSCPMTAPPFQVVVLFPRVRLAQRPGRSRTAAEFPQVWQKKIRKKSQRDVRSP